jgi:hypothetical protein
MPDEEDYRLPRTILSEALSSTPRLTPEEIKRWQETIIEKQTLRGNWKSRSKLGLL